MKNFYIKLYILILLLLYSVPFVAQNIQGVVRDSTTNEPLAYIAVFYDGRGVGSITDADGRYTVETRKGWNRLTFSVVGYTTKEVNIIPTQIGRASCRERV